VPSPDRCGSSRTTLSTRDTRVSLIRNSPTAGSRVYRRLRLPDAPVRVLLQLTADPKSHKERMHLDLETDDVETEAHRLETLGATRWNHKQDRGHDFWVMRDPWGNEFCVLQTEFLLSSHSTHRGHPRRPLGNASAPAAPAACSCSDFPSLFQGGACGAAAGTVSDAGRHTAPGRAAWRPVPVAARPADLAATPPEPARHLRS
jgi:hypothetical protein